MSSSDIKNNEARKRYELDVDGKIAILEYMLAGDSLVLSHTEVPEGLEGLGIGGKLAKHALEDIKDKGKKAIITCPFVTAYIKRHPEYKELVFGYKPKAQSEA